MYNGAIPTRATLKREYDRSIPDGEEGAELEQALTSLATARQRLKELRASRVEIARRASEHKRKLHDWKGKVPRAIGEPVPDVPDESADMPFVPIARITRATRAARDRGQGALLFDPQYVRAVEGLERFSKAWVIMFAESNVDVEMACTNQSLCYPARWDTLCPQRDCSCLQVYLVLVDIVERRGRSLKDKDYLIINGLDADKILSQNGAVFVVDVKPYLSYCEAVPSDAQKSHDEDAGSRL